MSGFPIWVAFLRVGFLMFDTEEKSGEFVEVYGG